MYDAGFTFQITDDTEASKTFKNITFRNNLVEYCNWAVEWWPTGDDGNKVENIFITDNIMRYSGYGWGGGEKRNSAHIRGPWLQSYFRPKNFRVTGNIFDCANGPIYGWHWGGEDMSADEHLVEGNRYYQRKSPYSDDGSCEVFRFGVGYIDDEPVCASNQQELEEAVKKVDPKAIEIKWLD